jgi:pimeloyl-ACP methyl ester carboxylesterase
MQRRNLLISLAAAGAIPATGTAAKSARTKPRRPFIATPDGTNLFYRDWGQGRALVFAAPWALNSDYWEYQIAPLSTQGVRCIAYDRRGHGRSDEPSHGYDLDTLADDLGALLDHLDLREVTLVGHSMGAAEVIRYLSRHGVRRIARVVLVAPVTPITVRTADNPEGVPRESLEKSRAEFALDRPTKIAEAAPGFFGVKNGVSQAVIDWWARQILQCSLKPLLELHRAYTEADFRPEVRAITLPTLLIHGDSDVSTSLDMTSRRTAALIRGSELKVYPGAAHGLAFTHKARLNEDLLSFASA